VRLESEAETNAKIQRFASRLSSRAPESLARFIASLAVDTGLDTGPLREHVQTFIVGDNLSEATDSLKERINALRLSEARHPHCGAWRNVGQRLGYILESIETVILPVSPATAFELLALTVERDEDVMMQCGGDTLAVDTGATRAAALLALAAKSLPSSEVTKTIRRLVAGNKWLRWPLAGIGEESVPGK
jgi:hypothetical protein